MKIASTFLTGEQRAAVERAVAEAEANTSAEIVVVLATRSGRYDRAEDLFGLFLGLVAVTVAWILWQDLRPDEADWALGDTLVLALGPVLAMFVLWTFVGAALATRLPVLASPFITRAHKEAEVRRRGFEAFHLYRVGHTGGRNGLLIYVSLLERMDWVCGDEAINARLPQSTWESASRAIAEGFAGGRPEAGLVGAVSLCGKALATSFPRRQEDAQELPNTLRIMD